MPRKCCSTKRSITVENLIQLACQLSSSQLNELIAALTALHDAISAKRNSKGTVQAELEPTKTADIADSNGNKRKDGAAHIAWKMINGCGPYPYLRFRDGKAYRSYYLKELRKE